EVGANGERVSGGGPPHALAFPHSLFATPYSLYHPKYKQSGDLLHPGFRVACPPAAHLQRSNQVGDRIEIVDRAKLVDMRQHGPEAAGAGLETVEAQQRIEPDKSPAGAVQPVHVESESVVDVAVKAVGDQKHNRALAEHPPRP